jgi:hypothetical protein
VVVFALTDTQYCRWLDLEARERRSRSEETELAGYLRVIAEAEDQVRQWIADYLQAQQEWHRRHHCGAERCEIYREVAPRLPAEWGARQISRIHGECRHPDDAFAGKLLILDEALRALCGSGWVEMVRDPGGDTTFRWSADPEAARKRHERDQARAARQQGRRKKGPAQSKRQPGGRSPTAATAQPDLRTLLRSLGGFVGLDE